MSRRPASLSGLLRLTSASLVFASLTCSPPDPPGPDAGSPNPESDGAGLQETVAAYLDGLDAVSSLYAKHVPSGRELAIRADRPMNTLSVIKVPIMVQAFLDHASGRLDLDERQTVTPDRMRRGSGLLQTFAPGVAPTLRDLVTQMIITSDNTATDIVIEAVGMDRVNRLLESRGYSETRLKHTTNRLFLETWIRTDSALASLSPREVYERGFPSDEGAADRFFEIEGDSTVWLGRTTAREMGRMLEEILGAELADPEASEEMVDILLGQFYTTRLPRMVRFQGVQVAHKTGDWPPYAGNDVGILFHQGGPTIISVFTNQSRGDFYALEETLGRIAEEIVTAWGEGAEEVATGEVALPEQPFTLPTGPHPVGVTDVYWTDDSRPEPFTRDPDDRRAVAARIWYPAEGDGGGGAPYLPAPAEFGDDGDLVRATHVRTRASADTPVSDDGPFPVLVYNHGGGWTRFTSTFTTVELASHGYVVVSVGHNGFNRTQVLPDGSSVVPDTLSFPEPTGDLLADAYGSWDYLDEWHFPEWVGDAVHALDRLEAANRDGPLAGAMDLESVGMYGWSFGGATSIEAAVVDDRVKAAIDHDGQLFGTASTVGTERPFMLLHAGATPEPPPTEDEAEAARFEAAFDELMGVVRATDQSLKEASTGDWYDVTIAGANHGSFSDLPLMVPGSSPGIDPVRAHEVINALTLAFFDRYLKGIPSSLLEDPTEALPEVTFDRRVQS